MCLLNLIKENKMERDIKKRRYNKLMGEETKQQLKRIKLVMQLINLYKTIDILDKIETKKILQQELDNLLKILKLSDEELTLFYYELQSNGV